MTKIDETAAAGSTSAGSIATVPSNRLGGMQTRMSLKDFMLKFHDGITNRYRFKPIQMEGSVESFEAITESTAYPDQVRDATSRLKDMQSTSEYDAADVISYGVRDDTGNMMLITIPLQQSEEFEQRVAQALADVLDFKKTGRGENKSLAELLYELKDEFTIVACEFPKMPKDAVYNADEITEADPEADMGDDEFGDDPEATGDMDDIEADMDTDMGDGEVDPEDEDMADDFDAGESKEDLLTAVLGMLKSQNEKETAQANAEAEKAKAQQAALAQKSSEDEVARQEEFIAAQAEMDAVKDKEKKAKELKDLATFRYKKRMGLSEGFSEAFTDIILELDPNDTPQTLRRQMTNSREKWRVEPEDDQKTRIYKQNMKRAEQKELRTRMQAAKDREDYEDELDDEEAEQQRQQDIQQQRDAEQDRGQL